MLIDCFRAHLKPYVFPGWAIIGLISCSLTLGLIYLEDIVGYRTGSMDYFFPPVHIIECRFYKIYMSDF